MARARARGVEERQVLLVVAPCVAPLTLTPARVSALTYRHPTLIPSLCHTAMLIVEHCSSRTQTIYSGNMAK